ncbi:MAG: hypothetical protein Ct9H300mP32_2170 [Verrucomicrobiota bacterium]|nr:MAG: hypothetical protein Ct9H300mP32_2170 [Verrucomicrobiota bacterium]
MLPGSTQKIADDLSPICWGPANCASFFIRNFCAKAPRGPDFNDPSLVVVGTHDGSAFPKDLRPFSARTPRR